MSSFIHMHVVLFYAYLYQINPEINLTVFHLNSLIEENNYPTVCVPSKKHPHVEKITIVSALFLQNFPQISHYVIFYTVNTKNVSYIDF